MKKYILMLALAATFTSCNYLDREPLDFGSEDSYYNKAEDLKIAVNDFYSFLPLNGTIYGGLYNADVVSDNQCGAWIPNLFYRGDKKTVKMADQVSGNGDQWNFSRIRAVNFFINKTESRLSTHAVTGNEALINHYLGEGYFFRAYDYFRLLRYYGDVPIFKELLPDDADVLTANSVRHPRNEVARFILEDLDKAISLLQENAPESGRITKDAALALKSRVALFEGTWERYHAGTCFVPGNPKWVGASTWPNFQFKSGSPEAEVNFFLDEAIKAAEEVSDKRTLDKDYVSMFNSTGTFDDNDEVILARYYKQGVRSHSCSAFLQNGGGCGVTRAAVNSFLMSNGLPIYADNSGYKGDSISYYELQGRDLRLTGSVRAAGSIIHTHNVEGKFVNDTVFYYRPPIFNSGNEKSTTGYEVQKWLSDDPAQRVQYNCTTAVPLFRVAECYLNYIEAYYERNGNLGGKCIEYWQRLRQRAGVDADIQKTINNTDLEQENDLAKWSHGKLISKELYNIRRERRCEFIAEGMRLDDLKRWRSLDNMVNYQPEGINLWTKMFEMYSSQQLAPEVVTSAAVSKYIHPLQLSSTSPAYSGYNFPKPHYLEPIPISQFRLTVDKSTGKTVLYQNPGWPSTADGTADYNYDCD